MLAECRDGFGSAGQDTTAQATIPRVVRKKWATKSRTGCLTCRKRRVKCDEATPVCRRCITAGLQCRYSALIPLGDAGQVSTPGAGDVSDGLEGQWRRKRVFKEAEPPDWDYLQAIRYYYAIVGPFCTTEEGKVLHPNFRPDWALYFVSMTLCTQVSLIAKSHDRYLPFGDSRVPATLWANQARCTSQIIKLINQYIQDAAFSGSAMAILYMDLLVSSDENLEANLWLAHINGCLAYVQRLGGARGMINWQPSMPRHFFRFMSKVVMHNTTIPARQQILGYANYREHELKSILSYGFDAERPCPPDICIVIIKITRLRYEIAATAATAPFALLVSTVNGLFNQLGNADVHDWAQIEDDLRPSAKQALGDIFRVAAWLYAILAIPHPVMSLWAQAQLSPQPPADGIDAYDHLRIMYRSKLVAMIRKAYRVVEFPPAFNWPLIVSGVAAVDGAADDRAFVAECLYAHWKRPVGSIGIFLVLQKLREFWSRSSITTSWEECFYEPTPC